MTSEKYLREELASAVTMIEFYENHLADDQKRLAEKRVELAAAEAVLTTLDPLTLESDEQKFLNGQAENLRDSIASLEYEVIPDDAKCLRDYRKQAEICRNLLTKLKTKENR